MRVLVYPHLMEIGGSQLNAIELAEQIVASGHEVVLFAPPGELNAVAISRGLDVVESASDGRWPTLRSLAALISLTRRKSIDLVHGYEWGPSVELAFGPYGLLGIPMLTTIMSMDVPHLIPVRPELIVGTAELAEEQRGVRTTTLAEPWIDTDGNSPGASGPDSRARFGLAPDDVVIAVVCRMTSALEKSDGVLAAMVAVHGLNSSNSSDRRHRLLVVGDGPDLAQVTGLAAELNQEIGYDQIVVTGGLLDPKPAYDCADIMIGMGSSALKGLSFAKPLVVQGAGGFWKTFDEDSVAIFDHQGFYGQGSADDRRTSAAALDSELRALLIQTPLEREALGLFGRKYIEAGYSLRSAAAAHLDIYARAIAHPPSGRARAATVVRTALELAKFKISLARQSWQTRRVQM